jgi:hypothetical protein
LFKSAREEMLKMRGQQSPASNHPLE